MNRKMGAMNRKIGVMNRKIGSAALLAAVAALSACGGAKKDPNALTDEESRQLNNAAEMLDAPDGSGANQDVALGNADGTAEENVGEDAGNGAGNGQ